MIGELAQDKEFKKSTFTLYLLLEIHLLVVCDVLIDTLNENQCHILCFMLINQLILECEIEYIMSH